MEKGKEKGRENGKMNCGLGTGAPAAMAAYMLRERVGKSRLKK